MLRRFWIAIALVAAVVAFVFWARVRIATQEKNLSVSDRYADADATAGQLEPEGLFLSDLDGRVLLWCTNANVPLEIVWGGEGRGILELLGFPPLLRPRDVPVGREPIREEWNVAWIPLNSGAELPPAHYLTENQGVFLHPVPSADGRYVVATRQEGTSQEVVRISLSDGEMQPVSFSHSLDRWPSSSRDGTRVLFHSYRDGNPGGDLYLAVAEEAAPRGWRTIRLTNAPEVEYIWPSLAADIAACAAVERKVGERQGRIVYWPISEETFGEPVHLTDEAAEVKFPTLSASGDLCCWQARSEGAWAVFLWGKSEGVRALDPPGVALDALYGLVQPTLTPDGRFVTFVEDHEAVGADRIGIYDLENGRCLFLAGCEGAVMFPSLTDPIGGGAE